MISQYTSKPNPLNYQIHPHLYGTLKEEAVTVSRPVSTKIRQTIYESTTSNPIGIGVVMDNFADVVGEIDNLQDRVDSIESLQAKMANLIDAVSNHVGIEDVSTSTVLPGFSQMEIINVIMEKVDSIENRLGNKTEKSESTSTGNIEERIAFLEKNLGLLTSEEEGLEKRIEAMETHLGKVTELEESLKVLNEKVARLSAVCQKLILQLKDT